MQPKLKRLKINKFRNIAETELHFDVGVNLILGENGTGKTTLLELISTLCSVEFGYFGDFNEDDGDLEFDLAEATWKLQFAFSTKKPPDYTFSLRFGPCLLTSTPEGTTLVHEGLTLPLKLLNPLEGDLRRRILNILPSDQEKLLPPVLRYFLSRGMEPTGCFAQNLTGYPPHKHQVRLPDDVLRILGYIRPEDVNEHCHTLFTSEWFLLAPNVYRFVRHTAEVFTRQFLSDGQKRLIGFFDYLTRNEHLVIADDLPNGLHHSWIEECMKAMGNRQAFLSSHNPLLFEYVDFGSIEQVQRTFIFCKSTNTKNGEKLMWENLPRDKAEIFYQAYGAEIESVGDILMNRGLW